MKESSSETTSAVTTKSSSINDVPLLERIRNLKRRASMKLAELREVAPSAAKREKIDEETLQSYCDVIKTYTKWNGNDISPRELASHGWKFDGRTQEDHTVRCISCDTLLEIAVPNVLNVDIEVYSKCLRNVRAQLKSRHDPTCSQKSISIDFYYLKTATVLSDVIKTLESYKDNITVVENGDREELSGSSLEMGRFGSHTRSDVVCAALNWVESTRVVGPSDDKVADEILTCDLCARYVPISADTPFDPLRSHFPWCPILESDSLGVAIWEKRISLLSTRKPPSDCMTKNASVASRLVSSAISALSS